MLEQHPNISGLKEIEHCSGEGQGHPNYQANFWRVARSRAFKAKHKVLIAKRGGWGIRLKVFPGRQHLETTL